MFVAAVLLQVDKILDSFYEYMDDRDRWQEAGVVKVRETPAAAPDLRQSCMTASDGLLVTQRAAGLSQHAQVGGTDRVSQTGPLPHGQYKPCGATQL